MAPEQLASNDGLHVRLLQDDDAEAVRVLFREVFKHEMSSQLWHWKYRAQDGHAVGVFREGELVCHYGGAGAAISFKGRPARALQSVDLMVKPSVRHLVRKQSPFFLASAMFLEQFVGYGKPYLLGYGFPSVSAMKLSERLGLFGPVGQMVEITWDAEVHARRPAFFVTTIVLTPENFDRHRRALDELWQRFGEEMRDYIFVQRDAAYLYQRYLRHPDIKYRMILVTTRFTGRPLGLIVLKRETGRVLLLDVVTPGKSMEAMLQIALQQTLHLGDVKLVTWCSQTFVGRFAMYNAASNPLPFIIPANTWTSAPSPDELREKWWLMPGDTDYL